jgi:hypothetical protein
MGKAMNQDGLVAIILLAAHKEVYGGVDTQTLDDLKNAMNDLWHKWSGKYHTTYYDDGNDLSLSGFEGQCLSLERRGIMRRNAKIPQTPVVEVVAKANFPASMARVTDVVSVGICSITSVRKKIKENAQELEARKWISLKRDCVW